MGEIQGLPETRALKRPLRQRTESSMPAPKVGATGYIAR